MVRPQPGWVWNPVEFGEDDKSQRTTKGEVTWNWKREIYINQINHSRMAGTHHLESPKNGEARTDFLAAERVYGIGGSASIPMNRLCEENYVE